MKEISSSVVVVRAGVCFVEKESGEENRSVVIKISRCSGSGWGDTKVAGGMDENFGLIAQGVSGCVVPCQLANACVVCLDIGRHFRGQTK